MNPDGRIRAVQSPTGVSPQMFRHVLMAVDALWQLHGVYPTPAEVSAISGVTKSVATKVMMTSEFTVACEGRGISQDREAGLTPLQMTALTLLSDFTDKRSTSRRLQDIGVPLSQFRGWMRQPLFAKHYYERAEQNAADIVPIALNRLVANIEDGHQQAIEFGLKMTGRYDPNAIEVQNARQVVTMMMELIVQFADEDTQRKILDGLDAKMRVMAVDRAITRGT